MMANAIGSKPRATAIGAKTGTVNKMIDMESIKAPKTNHTKIIKAKMAYGDKPEAKKYSLAAPVTPVMDNTREYNWAVTSSNNSGADVLPTEITASSISFIRIPRMTASIKANVAPTPAPSVGVKAPSQMPPSTSTTRTMIPKVLHKMVLKSCSGCWACKSRAAFCAGGKLSPSPTLCGCVLATQMI